MGFVKDAVGGLAKGIGSIAGSPLGQIGMGLIPGVGPIASTAMGALGGLIGGGGAQGAMKGAATGFGSQQLMEAFRQQQQDSQQARDLTNQAMGFSQQGADIALDEFGRDAPLRDAFRGGAMNFADPTNPFAQNQANFQPPAPQPVQGASIQNNPQQQLQQGPAPGSIEKRVSGILDNLPKFRTMTAL